MIPGIDARHDMQRIGASPGDEFLAVAARVRGFGGGPGWSLLIARIKLGSSGDLNGAVSAATETLARASRFDSGRNPDAVSWMRMTAKSLAKLFADCDSGLALDGAAYAHAGHPGSPDVDARSIWTLRDPLAEINSKARELQSRCAKGEPSIAYARMPLHESRRLIAGRIARRLPDFRGDPSKTPVSPSRPGAFRINPEGDVAMSKSLVSAAIAAHPQSKEVATAAALAGGEIVTIFQRSIGCIDLTAPGSAEADAARKD